VTGALKNTAMLTLFAIPLSFSLGYAMGAVAGCFPGPCSTASSPAPPMGVKPAELLVRHRAGHRFAVQLMVLPATGMGANGSDGFNVFRWSDARFLVLPVITLSCADRCHRRSTRAPVAEVLNQDFTITLRAKGLSEIAIVRHVLKNSLPQVLA